jgi:hypothetical protein
MSALLVDVSADADLCGFYGDSFWPVPTDGSAGVDGTDCRPAP